MYRILIISIIACLFGCASTPVPTQAPPVLSTDVRERIGKLAIRTPTSPKIELTANLDTKGKAAGKSALRAGGAWLGGTAGAAGQSGDPLGGLLVLTLGLVTTPVVAAGGAIYGASAADSKDAIEEGNVVLKRTLEFAPQRLEHALKTKFDEGVPIEYGFTGGTSNADLLADGYTSVLSVEMQGIGSYRDESGMYASLSSRQLVKVTRLSDNSQLTTRPYTAVLPGKSVSGWAKNDGSTLNAALDKEWHRIANEMTQDFFFRPSIRVQGLAPISSQPFRTTKLDTLTPTFSWSTLDGGVTSRNQDVTFEVGYGRKKNDLTEVHRSSASQLTLTHALEACKTYYWQVRAHYQSFGHETTSDWSPKYRFKTKCER